MEVDRAAKALSADGGSVVAALEGSSTLLIALMGAILLLAAAAGGGFVLRRRETDASTSGGSIDSAGDGVGDRGIDTASDGRHPDEVSDRTPETMAGDDATVGGPSFDERIGRQTLSRLEPVTAAVVRDTRDRLPLGDDASPETLNQIERELRTGIEDAVNEGKLDPGVASSLGDAYDVVNLPGGYRELTLSPSGETVHIAELERVAREALDQDHFRDTVQTVTTIHEHCRDVESYIRRHEEPYLDDRADVERTLSDIREMVSRFEGPLGERVSDFVVDGRHETLDGVVDIERQLDTADRLLHDCAFDDATRTLRKARDTVDDLLMFVDFLGGVTGTIDHGSGRITVPADVPIAVVTDLVPLFERQYEIEIQTDSEALTVTDRGSHSTGHQTNTSDRVADEQLDRMRPTRDTDLLREETSAEAKPSREQFSSDAVADEILFALREFDRQGSGDVVEWQTEQLPDSVARPEVLEPLATFCRRQTDIVESITLQEGAPPGFLEIEFCEGTSVSSGLDALRDRFAERHGS